MYWNSNVCPISNCMRDFHSQNMNDLDLDLLEWAKAKCKYTN